MATARGEVVIRCEGVIVAVRPNAITTIGHDLLCHRFLGDGEVPAPISHLAIGFGDDMEHEIYTDLVDEVYRTPFEKAMRKRNKIIILATIPPGAAQGKITEMGLFNAPVGGLLYARSRLALPRSVSGRVPWDITWSLTF